MKQIKDPIYGYVDIDDIYIQLINTPEFQRLRNIVQTSYQALYPSALHNRFVHSIGVFHLGEKLFPVLNVMFWTHLRNMPVVIGKEWKKHF